MTRPALFVIGHGSRSEAGVAELWDLVAVLRAEAPADLQLDAGFIELVEPDLDTTVDKMVADGATDVIGVPLVLLGAGHLKNDGPAALDRARQRHPGVRFRYAGPLGIHPLVLSVAEERINEAVEATGVADRSTVGVVLVGRGSSDPDANSDLAKVARLLQDSRGLDIVEPAFISLASPSVPAALERCRRLGASTIVVVPYFLFTGVLVDRIVEQAATWAEEHAEVRVRSGRQLGADPRIARLVLERHAEAADGRGQASCDCCMYRVALPGYEHQVGLAVRGHDHGHDHEPGHEPEGHESEGHDHHH
jgi:cobalt/nickel transport system ATP-binding protein